MKCPSERRFGRGSGSNGFWVLVRFFGGGGGVNVDQRKKKRDWQEVKFDNQEMKKAKRREIWYLASVYRKMVKSKVTSSGSTGRRGRRWSCFLSCTLNPRLSDFILRGWPIWLFQVQYWRRLLVIKETEYWYIGPIFLCSTDLHLSVGFLRTGDEINRDFQVFHLNISIFCHITLPLHYI